MSDSLSLRTDMLHDIGTIAILGLILVPFYLLLNQYWKSLMLLTAGYTVMGLAFVRLGRYIRRVMRRMPAEIPPWRAVTPRTSRPRSADLQFAAAEAMQYVRQDPHYLEEVLKPRLRRLLAYRIHGNPEIPLETLDTTHLTQLEPTVLDFLRRHDDTGLWSRYWRRQQRVENVLSVLRYLEALS